MKWFIILLITFFSSCQSNDFELETKQLIASELNANADMFIGFDKKQMKVIEISKNFIPERSKITFVDNRGFIYFELGKNFFIIKVWPDLERSAVPVVVVYPIDIKSYKRKK